MGRLANMYIQNMGVILHFIGFLSLIATFSNGQYVTLAGPSAVEQGIDTVFMCSGGEAPNVFSWEDVSVDPIVLIFNAGEAVTIPSEHPKYVNFNVAENEYTSTMTISNTLIEDQGRYRCTEGQTVDEAELNVEVGSASQPISLTSIDDDSYYQATCEAIGSSPEETITWILDGVTLSGGIVETDPQISNDSLFDKRSVFTFPATTENYKVQLECDISGHQVAKLNRRETRLLDIHKPPHPKGIMIGFTSDGTDLTVSCNTNDSVAAARPPIDYVYIYSNGTLVPKHVSNNTVIVTEPEQDTEFTCEGSNYLGNTTANKTFEPDIGSSPCMPESDRSGRYTVRGGGGNIFSVGIPSGSRVKVSIRCDMGATAQQSVTSQCSNGTWIPPWPRCEKPCSVPRNKGPVRQFVNGDATRPISSYYTPSTLPAGTQLVARCRDPGKYRLIGDQRRTCEGGRWTGEEPECQAVETQFLFYGAFREIASNGTIVVYVHRGHPMRLDVVCYITSVWLRPPRLTTPLVNDEYLQHWNWPKSQGKRLDPISTDFSGMYTCSGSSSFHSVHVLFKDRDIADECDVPAAPVHGTLLNVSRQQPRGVFPVGTTVSFECEDDYRLVGSRRMTCEKGQWSDDPPVCTESTEPPQRNGSCSNSCCVSPEYSCNPEGCYCDSWCESNDNCCDDYEDVCPGLDVHILNVFIISNATYNMRGSEVLHVFYPNYPKKHNNLENILWHVRNVHGHRFLITFLTETLHSIRDNVRIYTGISDVFEESSQIFHLTYNPSDDLPDQYWSVHPNMWLQFSTDAFGILISSVYGDCDGRQFQCTNGQCIRSSAVCDGLSDCVDSSDEYCS